MVLCPACRARVGDSLPTSAPAPTAATPATPAPQAPAATAPDATPASPPREDRVKRVLRELPPGEYSTGRIAKAAGLNHGKVLARLHSLEEAGEVRQVGKRWSTERPPTDLEEAMDRLQARTGNLRIVRERERVG